MDQQYIDLIETNKDNYGQRGNKDSRRDTQIDDSYYFTLLSKLFFVI
jgi:hypothetical protein